MLGSLFKKKPKPPPHIRQGLWGERVAARELKKKGHRILGRRVRFGRRDELDLVTRDGDTLVFVEVKTRGSEDFGRPAETVDRAKRHALSRAAVHYLQRLRQPPPYIRFDVVEIVGREDEGTPSVRHIENAFNLDAKYRVDYSGH
ncbi:MAG: YraN family protein [Kiritimatiellae bacterium]|nr:YraN family protein [Kiritimatiellia bacterium]